MAGGKWLSQNKVRPGAYINFKAVPKNSMTVGDRGIVAMALPLNWGKEGELIEVYSSDLLDGASKKKVGFTAFDSESKLLASSLSYCYKGLVYRMNKGGVKATATIGNLTVNAKYSGTLGNRIIVSVVANESLFDVITYVDGEVVDKQTVAQIAELEANDYVTFTGTQVLTVNAGTALEGGTNGSDNETSNYSEFLKLLAMARFQTLACTSSDSSIKKNVVTWIEKMRDDEGRYVQAVVADYEGADYEGIINSVCGVVIDEVEYTKEEFVAIVAGMTAGANITESNTGKKINGATKIIGELDDAGIKEGLSKGKFILSTSTSGDIKIEQDINSLHTFTKDKNYNFSKNRVMRTLDEIGTSVKVSWENSYEGKVDNDDLGRTAFKGDLIAYGNDLVRLSAIQNFAGADDITVRQGDNLDAVLADWNVQPVDSMEKLYMTVNVRGK